MFIVAAHYAVAFTICVAAITSFNFLQWALTLTTGAEEMRRIVSRFNDHASLTATLPPDRIGASVFKVLRLGWPIVFASVVLGPVPMITCALVTNSFWPSSPHPFSFLKIPSVAIGDTFILPIFNAYAFVLMNEQSAEESRPALGLRVASSQ